tara:strand:+ start:822 stop:1409 length:588 start_codon:yes stop_codon:yes gene_type:complete
MVLDQKPFSVQDMKCLEINDNASAIEVNEEKAFQCMYSANVTLQPSDPQHALSILLSPNYDTLCEAWQAGLVASGNCDTDLHIYNDAVAFPGAVLDSNATGINSFWNGQFAITKTPNDDFPLTLTDKCISVVQTSESPMCSSILPVFEEEDGKTTLVGLTFSTCAGDVTKLNPSEPVNIEFAILGDPSKFSVSED